MALSNVSTNNELYSKGFTCYWRIENFHWDIDKMSDTFLQSPWLKIHSLQSNWYMYIYKSGDELSVSLTKDTRDAIAVLDVSISVLTYFGWKTALTMCKAEFIPGRNMGGKICSLTELNDRKELYIPNGILTVIFNVCNYRLDKEYSLCLIVSKMTSTYDLQTKTFETFSTLKMNGFLPFPPLSEFGMNEELKLEEQKSKEVKYQFTQTDMNVDFKDTSDLMKMFKETEFSFVTLKTATKEFSVHKAVLCTKSHVFRAMFDNQMKENESNIVQIDDIDSQTMTTFVSFLHLQPLGDLSWENAIKLYYAADKYEVDALKKDVVFLLKKELTVENICDAFILADLHQDKELMGCAQEFFCKNSKHIFPSKKWKDLIVSHPKLISEILCKLGETM